MQGDSDKHTHTTSHGTTEKNYGHASLKRESTKELAALRWLPIVIAPGLCFSRQPLQL
jgi:hypothetical protein